VGHVAGMWEMRNACRVLVKNLNGREQLVEIDGRITLKLS
jgi:hypothetical protein